MASQKKIRDTILAEMKRQGLTTYALWKKVEGEMTKPTVYEYLAGRSEITTSNLEHLLRALGLHVSRAD